MVNNPKVHIIPPVPPKRDKRVGIYCRVSTNSSEQLKSLTAQVSHLTRITASTPQWLLVDVYMDIATSKTGSSRKEFTRMLNDCESNKLDIILIKLFPEAAKTWRHIHESTLCHFDTDGFRSQIVCPDSSKDFICHTSTHNLYI